MKITPFIFSNDVERAIKFYSLLGDVSIRYQSDDWTELSVNGASFGIHHTTEPITVGNHMGLSYTTSTKLTELKAMLEENNVEIIRDIEDQGFADTMVIKSPDGIAIEILNHKAN